MSSCACTHTVCEINCACSRLSQRVPACQHVLGYPLAFRCYCISASAIFPVPAIVDFFPYYPDVSMYDVSQGRPSVWITHLAITPRGGTWSNIASVKTKSYFLRRKSIRVTRFNIPTTSTRFDVAPRVLENTLAQSVRDRY
jgi:hypothetical protein